LQGGEGLENDLLDKLTALRSACGQLNHKLSARMPLAYAHVVRMLVDVYLFLATIASYKQLGIFAAFQTALLSVFYVGLLDLAFCLLDPLDDEADLRENESMVYLDVSVLLRESITASQRWIAAGSRIVRS
jgi:predicted membrane chloride channel (bestrophin family)